MKNFKKLLSVILVIALAVSLASCYVISGQKMRAVQGTYKLTTYTYTPAHERRDGYTPTTYDYVNGEKYMYEDYLVVTGTSTGYYVHKDASGEAYVKAVTLRYEYDTEDSSKVNYVIFNDSITVNSDEGGDNRLGVNKDSFVYSKAAFDYTELITKRKMRTDSLSVHWEKVSKATDLSYVTEVLGSIKSYDYKSFSMRGIYERTDLPTGEETAATEYLYYFYRIDTAEGITTATVYYATADDPNSPVKRTVTLAHADDYSTFTIDGEVWTLEAMSNNTYKIEGASISLIARNVSDSYIESLIKENSLVQDAE